MEKNVLKGKLNGIIDEAYSLASGKSKVASIVLGGALLRLPLAVLNFFSDYYKQTTDEMARISKDIFQAKINYERKGGIEGLSEEESRKMASLDLPRAVELYNRAVSFFNEHEDFSSQGRLESITLEP